IAGQQSRRRPPARRRDARRGVVPRPPAAMIGRLARRAAVVLLSLAAVGCLGRTTDSRAPIDIGAPGAWSVHRPMPTARQEVAVAVLAGRIFVIGGFGALAEPVPTVEVYDPGTDL